MLAAIDPVETTPLLATTSQCDSIGSNSGCGSDPIPTNYDDRRQFIKDPVQDTDSFLQNSTCEDSLATETGHFFSSSGSPHPPTSLINRRYIFQSQLPSVSLTLENKGSVARDHLALERTFLAYVRTSLAVACSGVAFVQLFTVATADPRFRSTRRIQSYIRPIGAATIVLALAILLIGVYRYFTVQTALTKGNFPVSRLMTGCITLSLTVLVLLAFGILVTNGLEPGG